MIKFNDLAGLALIATPFSICVVVRRTGVTVCHMDRISVRARFIQRNLDLMTGSPQTSVPNDECSAVFISLDAKFFLC